HLGLFFPILSVYLLSATYGLPQSVDTTMTAYSSWAVAEGGSLDLSEHLDLETLSPVARGQTVEINNHLYTNRFPGAIAIGVPFYTLFRVLGLGTETPSLVPAGLTAA